jgi:hypothetical protein
MLIGWIWRHRREADKKMLEIMERMAVTSERSAAAAEVTSAATLKYFEVSSKSAEAARVRHVAETALIDEERVYRKAEFLKQFEPEQRNTVKQINDL